MDSVATNHYGDTVSIPDSRVCGQVFNKAHRRSKTHAAGRVFTSAVRHNTRSIHHSPRCLFTSQGETQKARTTRTRRPSTFTDVMLVTVRWTCLVTSSCGAFPAAVAPRNCWRQTTTPTYEITFDPTYVGVRSAHLTL